MTDWERYLKKQDQKLRLARKIFYWSILCIFIVMFVFEGIALIPESKPDDIKEYSGFEYQGNDDEGVDGGITITARGTASDAIMITTTSGGIDLTSIPEDIDIHYEP